MSWPKSLTYSLPNTSTSAVTKLPAPVGKSVPKCQARIRTEKLKADKNHTAEDRLQSYCMTRIEKLLNSKGRQIIGWDEILEATSPQPQLLCHGVARQEESSGATGTRRDNDTQ